MICYVYDYQAIHTHHAILSATKRLYTLAGCSKLLQRCSFSPVNAVLYKRVDEKYLIQQCLAGSRKAQHELYEKYASKMLGVCYRYAQSLEDAEDVLQDGFVKVFTSLDKFRGDGSFEGWVRRIMVNLSLNRIKEKKYFLSEEAIDEVQWQPSEMDAKEIMDEIRLLPPGFRAVFNLYAIEGYSHKEIGEMLGINESTSRSQYTRARAMLMKRISDRLPITEKKHE